ncbi:hypothetical protein KIPE111705_39010 [Kibdelosporangium persicum]|uniref:Uncharacterized protein n=1 Tax=Kibdelosporangium persicum TaxID=2698649 RepID=A0ABX2FA83_9PSEU|nr:hypothetical protein [Kibdelosporangium persicum]NRN67802.1 hypothetical protein [Kibdelosporangium persicum]
MSSNEAITLCERQAQERYISERLVPIAVDRTYADEMELVRAGCRLGAPRDDVPGFRRIHLPAGWRMTPMAGGQSLWTVLLDEHGRVRAQMFHKSALPGRRQFVIPFDLRAYLLDCAEHSTPVVLDDTWATPSRVAATIRSYIEEQQRAMAAVTAHPSERQQQIEFCQKCIAKVEELTRGLEVPLAGQQTAQGRKLLNAVKGLFGHRSTAS